MKIFVWSKRITAILRKTIGRKAYHNRKLPARWGPGRKNDREYSPSKRENANRSSVPIAKCRTGFTSYLQNQIPIASKLIFVDSVL
uniref:Uncharacterized protein n=1 Tax=Romanomermis culicivorax TaxID=13658 RepID=A0A915J306_ROMCU